MLALVGKVLFGLSLGMTSAFVLGATSVGLWTLAWPTIVLTGFVGAAFWFLGKAIEPIIGDGANGEFIPPQQEFPPAYSHVANHPQDFSPSAPPAPSAPAPSAPAPSTSSFFFSLAPNFFAGRFASRSLASRPVVSTFSHSAPFSSIPHDFRVRAAQRRADHYSPGMATYARRSAEGATTVRHVSRQSVRFN